MQMGFHFDQTLCTGCYTCIVACKDWHDVPAGPASWMRLKTIEKGKYPDLFIANMIYPCFHCSEPACVSACPAGAISKREKDGIVIVDIGACLGKDACGDCLEACPYESPQFGSEVNAKMQKCDFCIDRIEEGKKPICVDACPMYALDCGPIKELEQKYGKIREAEGFIYSEKLTPSVIFKPKKDSKSRAVQKIVMAPSDSSKSM